VLQLERTQQWLGKLPIVGTLMLELAPIPVLAGACALLYILAPNTKVRWKAALVGGLVAGVLWHVNNSVSVGFVSQVNRNSKLYGKLVPIPVFMAGLYFFWLFLLFGAQVAYIFQNRRSVLAARRSERVHQDGRELVAVRIMTEVARRFARGEEPPSATALAERLEVPSELVGRIVGILLQTRLLVESTGAETGLVPGRLLDRIRVSDILHAMRRGVGSRLPTRSDDHRERVEAELGRVVEAEQVAGARTLRELLAEAS